MGSRSRSHQFVLLLRMRRKMDFSPERNPQWLDFTRRGPQRVFVPCPSVPAAPRYGHHHCSQPLEASPHSSRPLSGNLSLNLTLWWSSIKSRLGVRCWSQLSGLVVGYRQAAGGPRQAGDRCEWRSVTKAEVGAVEPSWYLPACHCPRHCLPARQTLAPLVRNHSGAPGCHVWCNILLDIEGM